MKKLIILIALFLTNKLQSQNLVLNSGFDSIITCPDGTKISEITPHWFSATKHGTPDVFNSCAPASSFGVPNSGLNKQDARSLNGYAGIEIYSKVESNGREYLQTKLTEKLEKNTQYFVRFFVSPIAFPKRLGYRQSYTNAISLKFTKTLLSDTTTSAKFYYPSIGNRKDLIKDTIGWTPVSGCYKAIGEEQFMTIGNFTPNKEMMIENEVVDQVGKLYYYIEDVSVMKFNPLPDTLFLCKGDSKIFDATFLESTYKWSTGKTESVETINESGYYTVEATIDGCFFKDSMTVIDPSEWSGLPKDTFFCKENIGIPLKLGINGSYKWSTGDTAQFIVVKLPDTYSVTVTNICGTYVYTSRVNFEKCGCHFYTPNIFSPNDDGTNDIFRPIIECKKKGLTSYKISIFNRQGEKVYLSQNYNEGWDGKFRGENCDPGVFVWYVEYKYEENGIEKYILESGDVALLK